MRTFIVSHRGTDAGLFWAKPRHADVSPSAEVQKSAGQWDWLGVGRAAIWCHLLIGLGEG
jgi:hypothetical protein